MTTWPAPQAEAWMREHPGRWLETTTGHLVCAHESGTLRRPVYLLLRVGSREARRVETINGLTFHPPREHYAAEVERLAKGWLDVTAAMKRARCGPLSEADLEFIEVTERHAAQVRALFRAAPEVGGE